MHEDAEARTEAPESSRESYRRRDGDALRIIGGFFSIFALLVLVGSFWEARGYAVVVNISAGVVLLLVGLGMFLAGRRLTRPR